MTNAASGKARLFRQRDGDESESPVTHIELFFDLVFVFAVTQLSHSLLADLSPIGWLRILILFLAMWWAWIYTSWATNWLDPDHGSVRLLIIAMMLGGLALASAIPDAFGPSGLPFACAYIAMQIGRTLFVLWASIGVDAPRVRNFGRILFFFALAAPLWIVGAAATPDARLWWWAAALAIEYAGPVINFNTPWLGGSTDEDFDIIGSHMAERCALFIIIALGEAVLVTGATFSELDATPPTIGALVASFLGSAVMWWIYFDIGAKRGSAAIDGADNAGRIARNAYTYLHLPIVAGVVVTAVADEQMLAHPLDAPKLAVLLAAVGGPALFLAGNQAFKWSTGYRIPPLSHFVGMALLGGIGVAAARNGWSLLVIGIAVVAALVVTAAWEWFSLNGGWRYWILGERPAVADVERDEVVDTAG